MPALSTTRQYATAFNQALSFNMSSVTNMQSMFAVRSARALAPTALSRALPVHAACAAVAPATPSLIACSLLSDSAGELGPACLVGVGKLRLAQLSELKPLTEVCVTVGRVYGDCSTT